MSSSMLSFFNGLNVSSMSYNVFFNEVIMGFFMETRMTLGDVEDRFKVFPKSFGRLV